MQERRSKRVVGGRFVALGLLQGGRRRRVVAFYDGEVGGRDGRDEIVAHP